MDTVTIGYFKSKEARFMPNVIIMDNLLRALSHYADIITTSVSPNIYFRNFRSIHSHKLNYLIADIKEFGAQQFILREKHKVDLPFIVILHTIFSWIKELVYIIPLIKKGDVIIAPSEWARRIFLKISPAIKVHFIPHCLDIKEIGSVTGYHGKARGKSIVYMGRLIERKGAGEIAECLPKIKKAVGDVAFNIIGPLDSSEAVANSRSIFVKSLQARIKNLGLASRVLFLGLKKGKEKYKLLSQNDVFVFPTTLKEENAPVSLLEALACGLPVITTDWAACKELVRQGKNGYLVPVGCEKDGEFRVDRKILTSRIIRILKDKKLRLRLSRGAVETAKKYDYKRIIPAFLKLLKKRNGKISFYEWKVLKNKQAVDFNPLFHRDFLFFIGYYRHSFYRTYGSLLKTKGFFGQEHLEHKGWFKKKAEDNALFFPRSQNKVRRDFEFFLLKP